MTRVDEIIAGLTLEQKVAQLTGILAFTIGEGSILDIAPHGLGQISQASMLARDPLTLATRLNEIQEELVSSAPGLPALCHTEATGGLLLATATAFPTALNQAMTWDPAVAAEIGEVTGREMRAIGLHQALAPVLDIARDPRWGRVHETYGEDPYLSSAMGAAFVGAMQAEGGIATAKHFLGYAVSEGGRNQANVHIGGRELRDIHARPFETAIRLAGLASIMPSYSSIDGEAVSGSRRYLTELLRDELGFEGVTVSDFNAVLHLAERQHVAPDRRAAAVMALDAGMDVEKPAAELYAGLVEAVRRDELDESSIDLAVRRHLDVKERFGLLDDPYVDTGRLVERFHRDEDEERSARIAARSLVLVHNDGTLPLPPDPGTVAVIGPFGDSMRGLFGGYTAASAAELVGALSQLGPEDDLQSVVAEIMFGSAQRGGEEAVEAQLRVDYAAGATVFGALQERLGDAVTHLIGADHLDTDLPELDAARNAAAHADLVVLVVGEKSGWGGSATGGEGRDAASLELPGGQRDLVDTVLATGTPVVAVLLHGRPLALGRLAECAALIDAGYPAHHGGRAVASVLFGDVDPGGRLAVSCPGESGHTPRYATARVGTHRPGYTDGTPEDHPPLGHGLSYTTFEYSDLRVELAESDLVVGCSIANTGERPGDEVVQLYLRDRVASVAPAGQRLEGFCRVTLGSGDAARVTFRLPVDQLAFSGLDGDLVVEPGWFDVLVGASARDIRLTGEFEIVDAPTVVAASRGLLADVTVS